MMIAIFSDSHDRWDNLEKAITIANKAECELVLFAGDLIAPTGVHILEKCSGLVKLVWGNNEGERVAITRKADASEKVELCGDIYEATVDGVKIFMNHYPRFVELAAKSGEFDLCIYGHTHQYYHEMIGKTLLLNPGEIQGATKEPGFVLYDTKTKIVKRVLL